MELIEPHVGILVGVANTVGTIDAAVVDVASHVVRLGAVEVAAGVVVDVSEETVHVHHGEAGAGETVHDLDHVRRAVLVDGVDGHDLLQHAVGDGGQVVLRLGWPVLVVADAALAGQTVEGGQLQGSNVLEDEETRAEVVERLHLIEDAVHVGDKGCARDLAVGDESVDAEIVGADPDTVDGAVCWGVDKLGTVGGGVGAVGNVGGNLILLNCWKVGVDGGEDTRSDVVGADGAGDGVVVEVGASVLLDVLGPCATTVGGVVVHWVGISDWRGRTVV